MEAEEEGDRPESGSDMVCVPSQDERIFIGTISVGGTSICEEFHVDDTY